ncbi:MAG: COX15/CtaA family protein, partial [Usitatibacteraceae bacterium]
MPGSSLFSSANRFMLCPFSTKWPTAAHRSSSDDSPLASAPHLSDSAAMQSLPSTPRPLSLMRWLLCVALCVGVMVVVGGITRLTESGLSITQWNPVTGAIPPLNDADWAREFALYQRTT